MININPLFEALQYFHRRAEGRLVRIELDRLCTRFPSKTNEFLRLLSPVADLQDRLDYLVRVGKRELSQLLTPVCSSPTTLRMQQQHYVHDGLPRNSRRY